MSKITAYTPLISPTPNDVLPVVDTDDFTMAPTGTTKQITVAGLLAPAIVVLTDQAVITCDASQGNLFRVTIGGNRTLTVVNGTLDGQLIRVEVTQGPGGPWTLSYSSAIDLGSAGAPALSAAAGTEDDFGFGYKAATGKWKLLAFQAGF